jgi:hypothetical protein
MERVKEALWSLTPWHPQYLPAASRFNAKLLSPIEFGEASIPLSELTELGSEPPADAIVAARLISSLDSRSSNHGIPVDAVLTRPLLSPDNHLIFPEGICRSDWPDTRFLRSWTIRLLQCSRARARGDFGRQYNWPSPLAALVHQADYPTTERNDAVCLFPRLR